MSVVEMNTVRPVSEAACLVDVANVRQVYHKGDNADLVVLDNVSLNIHEGEIVGLLGRSGSGKSTLLRIIAGLLHATSGTVNWCGKPVTGPCDGLSMVFQSFALFPWLTVLENVEIGLEALASRPLSAAAVRSTPSISSASTVSKAPIRRSFPAACASASALPARWWCIRA